MFPYDPELLAILTGPAPSTVDAVFARLTALDQVLSDTDGWKWFNWLYLHITGAVRDALATATWNNRDFVAELDVDFAALYFSAAAAFLQNRPCPACWRALFDARAEARIARIQFALAGVNAHINRDLAQSLATTAARLGVRLVHGGPEYVDFTALNPVLDTQIDAAEAELKLLLLGGAVPALDRLEDQLAAFSVAAAREAAWTNGEIVSCMGLVPALAKRHVDTLDGLAEVIGRALLLPVC